ncbi:histidine-containing phosphotransfer protein 1-like [Salvia miltiorrhiza]|uniref:histidine-containing phosphotransfer protein 1-like n=1 Tax=Salvia miltiorrhiza TaxID=226208 RepID=UPI0025ABEC41|nr:histidine-containing phosphotransfer protein 1-like [Salvia miltiorrhiza]
MEVQLQRSYLEYTNALFREGFLDSQFVQLQMLRDESNPDFVVEVVTLFFEDSQRILNELSKTLDEQNVDFKKIDANVHQLKGSSSSIGAQRVRNACIAFRTFCDAQNVESCLRCLQQVKQEYLLVKNKLEALLRLEQQIVAAGGVVPTLNDCS